MHKYLKIFFVLFLASCGGGGGGNGGQADLVCPRIAGGESCGNGSPVAPLVSVSGSGNVFLCSATMITSTQALTAGHCFYGKGIVGAGIVLGEDVYRITSGSIHPNYRGIIGQDSDLAIVNFERSVPLPTLPLFIDDIFEAHAGQVVQALGYGQDETGATGKLKSADMIIVSTEYFRGQSVVNAQPLNGGDAGSTCVGDSGGPAVYRSDSGEQGILGVVSYGPVGCNASSTSSFVVLQFVDIANWLIANAPNAQYR